MAKKRNDDILSKREQRRRKSISNGKRWTRRLFSELQAHGSIGERLDREEIEVMKKVARSTKEKKRGEGK